MIDYDHTGNIHWHEFLAATIDITNVDEGELRKAFQRLDFDDSGVITVDNLKELVGKDMTEEELQNLFNEIGAEGNKICFEDFRTVIRSVNQKLDSKSTTDADEIELVACNEESLMF